MLREAAAKYAQNVTSRTDFFKKRGLPDDLVTIAGYGLVTDPAPEHLAYRGRISIPYKDCRGVNYISFRCACTTKECEACVNGKYKYLAGTGLYRPLYNSYVVDKDLDKLYVTEGEFNADVMMYCGLDTVATNGATRFNPQWAYEVQGLAEIIILKDGDGDPKAADSMVRLWRNKMLKEARIAINERQFPPGHDPNSLFQEIGKDALRHFALTGEL